MEPQQYSPILFNAIAKEVVRGYPEQYLFEDKNGSITVMFSTPEIENSITRATLQKRPTGIPLVAAEFMTGVASGSCRFTDECDGTIVVDGVVVELTIRKIKEEEYRVLFTRVDAQKLLLDTQTRLKSMTARLERLESLSEASH